jgi:antitoxin component YwqK of YwqJK toxin-antitoxin module
MSIQQFQMDLLDGQSVTYYPNGKILEIGSYVQGRKHGEFDTFYDTGVLKSRLVFDMGRPVRKPEFFNANGRPMSPGIDV